MERAILQDRRVAHALGLALAGVVAWQLALFSPVKAPVAVGALALAAYSFAQPRQVMWGLLVLKPLVDLTWAVPVISVGAADYNVQMLQGAFVAGWCVVFVELLVWLGLKRRVGTAVLVAAGAVGAVLIHWTFVAELFRTFLFVFQSNTDLTMADFLSGRGHMFLEQGHLSYWLRSGPLVHAFGFGTPRLEIQGIVYDQTDCDYLRVLVSYGVVGLTLYVATLAWCVRQGLGLVREAEAAREPFWRDVGIVTVVLTLAVALFAVTTYSLHYPILVWIFFAIVSIAAAARRRLQAAPAVAPVETPNGPR